MSEVVESSENRAVMDRDNAWSFINWARTRTKYCPVAVYAGNNKLRVEGIPPHLFGEFHSRWTKDTSK